MAANIATCARMGCQLLLTQSLKFEPGVPKERLIPWTKKDKQRGECTNLSPYQPLPDEGTDIPPRQAQ